MGAAKNIHPDQLRMLVPAHEMATKWHLGDTGLGPSGEVPRQSVRDQTMASKLRAADSAGLTGDIKARGIEDPVTAWHGADYSDARPLDRPYLRNGHHRLSVAHSLDPKTEVPVEWQNMSTIDAARARDQVAGVTHTMSDLARKNDAWKNR